MAHRHHLRSIVDKEAGKHNHSSYRLKWFACCSIKHLFSFTPPSLCNSAQLL